MAIVALIAVLAGGLAWTTWPRPAITIHVSRGGVAQLVTQRHQGPLPDTVRISGSLPVDIRITNDDTIPHRLGMFAIAKGHTTTYQISQPGVYSGFCSAHRGRHLTYIVQ